MGVLNRGAATLSERKFDAIHLHGPGTDLTLGLFQSSAWEAAEFTTVDGLVHFPNLPTEEVFTTPDPLRVDGHVTATMPLELYGTIIRGLRVEFAAGRVTGIEADENAETLRTAVAKDEGAARLGELALVDGSGRIGPLQTVFFDTLLDENAASHIALGNGFAYQVADEAERQRVNQSQIHIDFMIGSPELDVDGITEAGERVPVLRQGAWQICAVMANYGSQAMWGDLQRVLVRPPLPADANHVERYGWRGVPDVAAAVAEHEELRALLAAAGAEVSSPSTIPATPTRSTSTTRCSSATAALRCSAPARKGGSASPTASARASRRQASRWHRG